MPVNYIMKKQNKKNIINQSGRIIVTGALGHIGSKLIREISKNIAVEVVMIDNLSTQRYPSLFDLPKHLKYKFIEGDIRTLDLKKIFKGSLAVIHLAALTDAQGSIGKEEEVDSINYIGLKRVADACLATKTRLLFPSTTSVYGTQKYPVDEKFGELKPQSPYAKSKLKAEDYLLKLKKRGLQFVICRFGTIFGHSVGMRFHTAVNKFTWQAVNNIPVTVWKTAWKQKRPYLDLKDCIKAINFILEKDLFDGEIYNVLTKNYTVENVVETIKGFTPDLKIKLVNSPIMNQLSYDVDDTKFRKLGFKPTGDLKKGIGEKIIQLKSIIEV